MTSFTSRYGNPARDFKGAHVWAHCRHGATVVAVSGRVDAWQRRADHRVRAARRRHRLPALCSTSAVEAFTPGDRGCSPRSTPPRGGRDWALVPSDAVARRLRSERTLMPVIAWWPRPSTASMTRSAVAAGACCPSCAARPEQPAPSAGNLAAGWQSGSGAAGDDGRFAPGRGLGVRRSRHPGPHRPAPAAQKPPHPRNAGPIARPRCPGEPSPPAPGPAGPGPQHPMSHDGTFVVGKDVLPGSTPPPDHCRATAATGRCIAPDGTTLENALSKQPQTVQIDAGDMASHRAASPGS